MFRLDRAKAVSLLACKARRLALLLQASAARAQTRAKAAASGFSSTSRSVMPGAGADVEASAPASSAQAGTWLQRAGHGAQWQLAAVARGHMEAALGVMSEYLSAEWLPLVSAALLGTDSALNVLPTSPAAAAAAAEPGYEHANRAAQWNRAAKEESTMDLSRFVSQSSRDPVFVATSPRSTSLAADGTSPTSVAGSAAKTPSTTPLTLTQKRLAQVSTKGMKPLSSFFGSKPS
jgi:hypothetical protein